MDPEIGNLCNFYMLQVLLQPLQFFPQWFKNITCTLPHPPAPTGSHTKTDGRMVGFADFYSKQKPFAIVNMYTILFRCSCCCFYLECCFLIHTLPYCTHNLVWLLSPFQSNCSYSFFFFFNFILFLNFT